MTNLEKKSRRNNFLFIQKFIDDSLWIRSEEQFLRIPKEGLFTFIIIFESRDGCLDGISRLYYLEKHHLVVSKPSIFWSIGEAEICYGFTNWTVRRISQWQPNHLTVFSIIVSTLRRPNSVSPIVSFTEDDMV
jgi:hypothetical protein